MPPQNNGAVSKAGQRMAAGDKQDTFRSLLLGNTPFIRNSSLRYLNSIIVLE